MTSVMGTIFILSSFRRSSGGFVSVKTVFRDRSLTFEAQMEAGPVCWVLRILVVEDCFKVFYVRLSVRVQINV